MVDWLTTLAGETRTRLLRLVRDEARSVAELAAQLDISGNAVRTHVAALERDGLVRPAGKQRSTGGKPARLYELTPEAEELFPKAYAQVLGELVEALREEYGEESAVARLREVGRRLGMRAGAEGGESARVEVAAALLEAIGGSVEVLRPASGVWELRAAGCPLSAVVARDPEVCALAEALVAEVTGLPVEERCDRKGRPRCAFRVSAVRK